MSDTSVARMSITNETAETRCILFPYCIIVQNLHHVQSIPMSDTPPQKGTVHCAPPRRVVRSTVGDSAMTCDVLLLLCCH